MAKEMENKELIADAIIAILKDGGTILTANVRGIGCALESVDDLLNAYGLLRHHGEIDCQLYEELEEDDYFGEE